MPKKIAKILIILLIVKVVLTIKNSSIQPLWSVFFNESIPLTQKVTINKMYKIKSTEPNSITLIKNKEDPIEQNIWEENSKNLEDSINTDVKNLGTDDLLIETIGLDQIIYQPETNSITEGITPKPMIVTADDLHKLNDIDFLKRNFYTVANITDITLDDIKVEEFINYDFSIDKSSNGPKILIMHTHSLEMYKDSDISIPEEGILGVGDRLAEILENKYNIQTMHHKGRYDVVGGKPQISGAYERMEPDISRILKENPSIEVLIDLHRDGVPEDIHLVTKINNLDCAQIMFFNGISKIKKGNQVVPIQGLENPYLTDNLALSFNMQLTANALYEHFTRKVYINAYRYSLSMLPKSMLIEVGAQTNTKQEALNAMEPLAEILSKVLNF